MIVAEAGMLIRRPVAEVFNAFVDPAITSKFWFTKGSGKLEKGEAVTWEWEMYEVSAEVTVEELEENKRIVIRMPYGEGEKPTHAEWTFTSLAEDQTFVEIKHSGFSGSKDEIAAEAIGSTGGFTIVLAGLKAWLEHGIELNLVGDRFPKGLGE